MRIFKRGEVITGKLCYNCAPLSGFYFHIILFLDIQFCHVSKVVCRFSPGGSTWPSSPPSSSSVSTTSRCEEPLLTILENLSSQFADPLMTSLKNLSWPVWRTAHDQFEEPLVTILKNLSWQFADPLMTSLKNLSWPVWRTSHDQFEETLLTNLKYFFCPLWRPFFKCY